ncbi:hypothetical protein EW026_g7143 [Hermanssonia centrifuga]|uniref:Uncharacterized protein n=1 Tax=Hermanssonia centrifuga TaxID=98765 RepID=A0A4S4K8V5_9APHY|nr:hypothetical protein EW026_g7143 [Hermanssonia centrifuga]
MKSRAEREGKANQSDADDSPGKSKGKGKGKGRASRSASTRKVSVKLETPTKTEKMGTAESPLTPLSQLSITPVKLDTSVKLETPVRSKNKRGVISATPRTPNTPRHGDVPQVVDDMFMSNMVASNSAASLFPILGKRNRELDEDGKASPSSLSSSSLPSVGEILRASKRPASSPTPVRRKIKNAAGSILWEPMPKTVSIGSEGEAGIVVGATIAQGTSSNNVSAANNATAANEQTVANKPIEAEENGLLCDDKQITRFWRNKRVFTDKTPILVDSDEDYEDDREYIVVVSDTEEAGKAAMKPHVGPQAGVKREETDVSLSSEDNMTVISSHPCAVVDLRVVIWIETVCDLVEPAADKELRVFSTTTGCWVARKVDEILADVGEDELDGELARLYGGVRAYA